MPYLEQIYSRVSNYFSVSHFLVGFDKCDRLHGHNYMLKIRITYQSENPEHTFDFRTINMWIKQIITKLDHKILLPGESKHVRTQSVLSNENWLVIVGEKSYSFPKKDVIILEGIDQTTTENLAIHIHQMLREKIKSVGFIGRISQLTVIISETVGNEVSYTAKIK